MAPRISTRPVSLPPASGDCFQTASNWLEACLLQHPDCITGGDSSKLLPTRVIDVGRPGGSQTPFLCNTVGRSGQWAALSHYWGGTEPLRSTSAKMKNHEESLPMGILPPLFRDAVLITRRLNYRYLWIDSLCIIQNSKSDWQIESAEMGYIYRNAVFTIAAEAAADSENASSTALVRSHFTSQSFLLRGQSSRQHDTIPGPPRYKRSPGQACVDPARRCPVVTGVAMGRQTVDMALPNFYVLRARPNRSIQY
jgi:hypothetical protein